jgi:hypothetical protein
MTAAQTVTSTTFSMPNFKPIIEDAPSMQETKRQNFDPVKHLTFTPPEQVIMMSELGYPADMGVSPVAVSQPFKLFSNDAVQQMRAEILNPELMEHYGYQSNIAASQLRGYSPK